ncbi:Nicalin-1 [Nymphaea thermarum]|nr:Nicalin-1 [Nymphaea thermarum]
MAMRGKRGRAGEVLESIFSLVLSALVLLACVELGDAAAVVDVYRLIQYDLSGVPFGSRRAALNHHAGSSLDASGVDLSRTVVIVPIRQLNLTFLQKFLTDQQPLGGLLLLLPESSTSEKEERSEEGGHGCGNGELRRKVMEMEQILMRANIPYPVYFAFEEEKVNAMLADVEHNDATGQPSTTTTGGYKLVVSTSEPKRLTSPSLTNIQGWLLGSRGDGDVVQLPTIAIVASYDTFGAAPALSVGSDSNGSGVIALLEIARLFSRLYSNAKTRGRFNLLFGLTSGGPYNYNGTMKWLRSFDQRIRESIDYAICLNSIGSSNNELWLHVSKPPENAYIKQLHESFASVAEELGIKIGIKHKKINISNSRVAWEHEQFSRQRITALTISELTSAPDLFEKAGGIYDTRHSVNEAAVIKGVKLVAESLARHIYGQQQSNVQIFADGSSLAVNPSYIRLWLDLLSRTPRVAPFLSKNDPLILALEKELSDHVTEVNMQHELLDGAFSFYDLISAKLHIYQVASVTFDLLLLLAVGSYLILLFCCLIITTRGLDDLIGIFRRPPTRKVKSA